MLLSAGFAVVLGGIFGIAGMFVSLAAASALAYVLLMVIVTVRYGREVRPMMKCVVLFLALID